MDEMLYPPTDAGGIEGGDAEGGGSSRAQQVKQGERRMERLE